MNAFDQMPDNAMVWIYAANRKLLSQEQDLIRNRVDTFMQTWTAHDMPVKSASAILHDVFVVLMADPQASEISGCGIDKSLAFFKSLTAETGIDFFNRMSIELLTLDGLIICDKAGAAAMLQAGTIDETTLTFDKTLTQKHAFDTRFTIPLTQSWFYRYIKPAVEV
ncbi:MAG: hypothetical protein WC760_13285 [Bacteroidia bacterium]|jgi:hypothetical protein